jgi:hypothetical protein
MKLTRAALEAVTFALIVASANAGTLTPIVDAPGADPFSTGPVGINDFGVVGGGYTTGGGAIEHGFIGPATGPYVTFDYSTTAFVLVATEVRALNNAGDAVGFGSDRVFSRSKSMREFLRTSSGTIITLTDPSSGIQLNGIGQGINSAGYIVGDYDVPNGSGGVISRGFILSPDRTMLTTLSDPLAAAIPLGCGTGKFTHGGTRARGINDSGTVTGFYFDANCLSHGFVYDSSSRIFTTLDHPLALGAIPDFSGTFLPGINNAGEIAGDYYDASGNSHGFVVDATHTQFTEIVAPGAVNTQVFGINNLGQVTVASDTGGFIWSPTATTAPTDVLLPITVAPGQFRFQFAVTTGVSYYVGLQASGGYDFQTGAGDPNFSRVTVPHGISVDDLKVWVCDGAHICANTGFELEGGSSFNFLTHGWPSGVSEFALIGTAGNRNSGSPVAFVSGVQFMAAGHFTGTAICKTRAGGTSCQQGD